MPYYSLYVNLTQNKVYRHQEQVRGKLADIRFVAWRCIVQEIWSIQDEAHFQQHNIWESANQIFEDFLKKSRRRIQIVQKYGGSGKKPIFVHSEWTISPGLCIARSQTLYLRACPELALDAYKLCFGLD